MTVREIINSLEAEKKQLREEINNLKEENKKLMTINEQITADVKNLMEFFLKKNDEETIIIDKPTKPVVEEVEAQVTSIVTNVNGKVNASIVEGGKISIDDVVEETPAKPKRSRKKKVEPVEEPIENV